MATEAPQFFDITGVYDLPKAQAMKSAGGVNIFLPGQKPPLEGLDATVKDGYAYIQAPPMNNEQLSTFWQAVWANLEKS